MKTVEQIVEYLENQLKNALDMKGKYEEDTSNWWYWHAVAVDLQSTLNFINEKD